MPSQEKTHNIGLNQWQGNEYIKRQDFVEDNFKIDEAIHSQGQQVQEVYNNLESHAAEGMPHRFVDSGTGKTYKWGLSAISGKVAFNYEEV
ncbi:hypothetical protein [Alkaliphilus peptidifermentans]|uniref:Uncharacterized protein n=1 Tax=Alkaliphilus peptidifermentans DSM 18978 TaxID=1120976 RepID=A0A1G5JX67_9FIRM|nr:hypothetical protein [Alkaliphilus peptidifermentans]SCY92907.1 hypothetical protein SAMN03080606_03091 [Alkaliphilus peptidifermentans DSM 18978]